MTEDLQFIPPKNSALADKIMLYYFHSTTELNYSNTITYYPNFTSTLNIYKNSVLTWNDDQRSHSHQESKELLKLLVGKLNKSRKINATGPFNKITIVFHPLGLNNFITDPLSTLIEEHFSFFDYYGASFDDTLEAVFKATDFEQKRDLLDEFFLNQLHPFKEDRLIKAVKHILNTDEIVRINKLTDELNLHRRTLLRLFQKHMSYSIEEFVAVVKFRKALLKYQKHNYSLTQAALGANYYDQSDFIKKCKLKCGQSPRKLFARLKTLEKELFWTMD